MGNTIQIKNALSQWMVIYTRSRFEKKIDKSLNECGITSFCPIVKSKKKWADRTKTIELPLFPSYVFVKANPAEQHKVKQIPGVMSFLMFCGKPVLLNDSEIERIRTIVKTHSDIELVSIQSLNIGSKVKIKDGLLLNYQGVISQIMGKNILMTIEELDCVLTVKVNLDQVCLNVAS